MRIDLECRVLPICKYSTQYFSATSLNLRDQLFAAGFFSQPNIFVTHLTQVPQYELTEMVCNGEVKLKQMESKVTRN